MKFDADTLKNVLNVCVYHKKIVPLHAFSGNLVLPPLEPLKRLELF